MNSQQAYRWPRPRTNPAKHGISGLFVFLLIACYALFALLLVMIGIQAYQNVMNATGQNSEVRTTIGYLGGRVRSSDGDVRIAEMDGHQVMVIEHALGDDMYETRIYFLQDEDGENGMLYEQVIESTEPFDPELGEPIASAKSFNMAEADGLIEFDLVSTAGQSYTLHMKKLVQHVPEEEVRG